jgi:hypothetical protein
LITSTPLSSAPEDVEDTPPQRNGLLNEEGAWCWREDCQGAHMNHWSSWLTETWFEDCLKLTKAMQKTSDSLQIVADLYDDHVCVWFLMQGLYWPQTKARRTQLATHEAFKSVAHPYQSYEVFWIVRLPALPWAWSFQGIIETHQSTVSRYKDALKSEKVRTLAIFVEDDDMMTFTVKRWDDRTLRNCLEYYDGWDGHIPRSESGKLQHNNEGASWWRNKFLRAGPTQVEGSPAHLRLSAFWRAEQVTSSTFKIRTGFKSAKTESYAIATALSSCLWPDAYEASEYGNTRGYRSATGKVSAW